LRIRNNIVYQTATSLHRSGVPYLVIWNPTTHKVCADSGDCSWIRGSNNLFYGSGAAPRNTNIANSVNANPQFAGLSQWIFHLQPNSPARNKGVDTGLQGGAAGYDIGVREASN
jgi:hypothetical protein